MEENIQVPHTFLTLQLLLTHLHLCSRNEIGNQLLQRYCLYPISSSSIRPSFYYKDKALLLLLLPPCPTATGYKHETQQDLSLGITKLTAFACSCSSFMIPAASQPSWTYEVSAGPQATATSKAGLTQLKLVLILHSSIF